MSNQNKPNFILDVWQFHWETMEQFNAKENKWYPIRWNEDTQEIEYFTDGHKWRSYRDKRLRSEDDNLILPIILINSAYKQFQEEIEKILLCKDTNEQA